MLQVVQIQLAEMPMAWIRVVGSASISAAHGHSFQQAPALKDTGALATSTADPAPAEWIGPRENPFCKLPLQLSSHTAIAVPYPCLSTHNHSLQYFWCRFISPTFLCFLNIPVSERITCSVGKLTKTSISSTILLSFLLSKLWHAH